MTRIDTRNHYQVSVKPKGFDFCRFVYTLSFIVFLIIVYIILKKPVDSLDDPSDQFSVKHIPATYTKLEGIDPEERDVFEGFRTSFLPAEEIVFAQRKYKRALYDENLTDDSFIWENTDEQFETPTRIKRRSNIPHSSTDFL